MREGQIDWTYQLDRAQNILKSLKLMEKMNGRGAVEKMRKATKALQKLRPSKQRSKLSKTCKHVVKRNKETTNRPAGDASSEGKI